MNRKLARVTERAGLGHWSMTELARHSAASLLSDAGVPLEQIADQLGHSSTANARKALPPPGEAVDRCRRARDGGTVRRR